MANHMNAIELSGRFLKHCRTKTGFLDKIDETLRVPLNALS